MLIYEKTIILFTINLEQMNKDGIENYDVHFNFKSNILPYLDAKIYKRNRFSARTLDIYKIKNK